MSDVSSRHKALALTLASITDSSGVTHLLRLLAGEAAVAHVTRQDRQGHPRLRGLNFFCGLGCFVYHHFICFAVWCDLIYVIVCRSLSCLSRISTLSEKNIHFRFSFSAAFTFFPPFFPRLTLIFLLHIGIHFETLRSVKMESGQASCLLSALT